MKEIIDLLAAIGDYKPKLTYDPYEEDACGCYNYFTVAQSGLGPIVKFVDGTTAFFSDDDGSLVILPSPRVGAL